MDIWFTAFVMAIAVLVAIGGSLLLVGYLGTLPASLDCGWKVWVPTVVLPVLGPIWFAMTHRADYSRAAMQLIFGVLLLGVAAGLLFGFGPHFVDRMAAGIK